KRFRNSSIPKLLCRRAADALLSALAARARCNRDIDGIRGETPVRSDDRVVSREEPGGRTKLGACRICVIPGANPVAVLICGGRDHSRVIELNSVRRRGQKGCLIPL